MAIAGRLKRVETILTGKNRPGVRTFEQFLADFGELEEWRESRGYPDFLSALEDGETLPERLEDLLEECATYDRRDRTWARIESSLAACAPPDDFDVCLPPRPAPIV
jgi:hypothetical protein